MARRDRTLLVGLAVASIILSTGLAPAEEALRYLLNFTRQLERDSGFALVPALLILTIVFVFHLYGKRQEAKTEVVAAGRTAAQAQARAAELERLVWGDRPMATRIARSYARNTGRRRKRVELRRDDGAAHGD